MVVLFVLAVVLGSWAPRVPQVKSDLGLGDGQLGLALLGAPSGAVASLWLAGLAVTRVGSAAVVRAALPAYCGVGALLMFVHDQWSLFALLALWGATSSGLDIAANAQAIGVQDRYGRPIMSTAHAAWTAGALSGAGIGTAAASLGVPAGTQFAVLGALCAGIALPVTRWMLTDPVRIAPADPDPVPREAGGVGAAAPGTRPGPAGPRRRRGARGPFAALCAVSFGSFLCEGVAADWSGVYLTEVTGVPAGRAGAGFIAFTVCMLAVRLVGDRALGRFGPARTVRALATVAIVGFAGALALAAAPVGVAAGVLGFGAIGAGTACVAPAVFSRAAQLGVSAGRSIAVVSTVGYAGWLTGPPLVGALAELAGLHRALAVVVLLLATIAAFAPALRDPDADADAETDVETDQR
ncbi:Sugar phosphate permease [Frankia sp. AgKG'84/4]